MQSMENRIISIKEPFTIHAPFPGYDYTRDGTPKVKHNKTDGWRRAAAAAEIVLLSGAGLFLVKSIPPILSLDRQLSTSASVHDHSYGPGTIYAQKKDTANNDKRRVLGGFLVLTGLTGAFETARRPEKKNKSRPKR